MMANTQGHAMQQVLVLIGIKLLDGQDTGSRQKAKLLCPQKEQSYP
jgi:hypothetical protein